MSREPAVHRFGLEELEPRVLLSANFASLGAGANLAGPAQPIHGAYEIRLTAAPEQSAALQLNFQGAAADVFAGLEPVTPVRAADPQAAVAHSAESVNQSADANQAAVAGSLGTEGAAPSAIETNSTTTAAQVQEGEEVGSSAARSTATVAAAATSLAATSVYDSGAKVFELTTTLKGANSPPVAGDSTLTILQDYIAGVLAGASGNEINSTQTLGSASLGGVLQLDGVTLTFAAKRDTAGGAWSGTVNLSVTTATLFPGKSFRGSMDAEGETPALTGTFTIGGTYSLTISAIDIRVGEALTIVASGVSFTYDPNGAANQVLATVTGATVASPQFSNMATATLSNFKLRADGFAFDGFELNAQTGLTPGIGNFLTATSAKVTASNINVTFGATPSFSGTVGLTLTGFELFPTGDFMQSKATSVTAAYDFGGFDGTSAVGRLTLTVSGFEMNFGKALKLTTGGDIVLTPGLGQVTIDDTGNPVVVEIGTIASAVISSPQFTGLGTFTITDLKLRQDGVTLGNGSWTSAGPVSIGDTTSAIIRASSATINLLDFKLLYGAAPKLGGSISVSAANVVLFPNIPVINLSLGNLSGTFQFTAPENPGDLSLSISALNIPIGDALTIHLGSVTFTPFNDLMLSVANASVTANLFTGSSGVPPSFTLPKFELTRNGFSLGSFNIEVSTEVKIGDFLSLSSLTIAVTNFSVSRTSTPMISGTIEATLGTLSLFPSGTVVSSSFTELTARYDFGDATRPPGHLTLSANSFVLTVGGQVSLSAGAITITPALTTIATIGTAELKFMPLENLVMTISGLEIRRTGFSVASATASYTSNLSLGGLLTLEVPTVTLTNINYVFGASLSGTIGFSTERARLDLGPALSTSASTLTGSYNLASGVLNVTMASFDLNVAGFATLGASGASITYAPSSNGTSEVLVGVTGARAFLGFPMGSDRAGVELTGGTLALAVFRAANGDITYSLCARGTVSLVGLPADTVSATGTVEFRKNTAGSISKQVVVGGSTVYLNFTGNEQSVTGQSVGVSVGSFVSLTGNFGFTQFTSGSDNYIAVGASSVNAAVSAGGASVSLNNASLGLLIKPGATSAETKYALVATGGAGLTGVPGLALSGSLSVRVRHGLDAAAVSGLPSIPTGGSTSVSLNFEKLGSGTGDVTDVQGTVALNITNFVSISGSFGFQQFTNEGSTYLAAGANGLSIVLGTATTNLTLANASLGLVIAPGTGGSATTYALQARGSSTPADTGLNGVPGFVLNASDLLVSVRRGLDVAGNSNVPKSVLTPAGEVTLDFSKLPTGMDITDIRGHATLAVTGFGSLDGDFGFQSYVDGAGNQSLAIGATGVTVVLGTASTNLTVSGASFGALIRPGNATDPAAYALQATASNVSLNGVPGLSVTGSSLSVRLRNGLDISTASGIPTSIQTSGGAVTPDFAGLGSGSTKLADIQGTVAVSVSQFVTLSGSFGFQSYQDGADSYLAVGAKNVTATLAAGSVNLTIANASAGIIVKQGTPTTYALVARGSTVAADTTLNGVPGLSVSATNLLVRARSGLDPATLPASIPNAILTPAGSVTLDFTGLKGGTSSVTDIQGHLTLSILNFVSLKGDFGFQWFADGNDGALAIGAANVTAVLGTPQVNVSITGASLGVLIKPGVGYALLTNSGTISLNGVSDLTMTGSLSVKVRQGLSPASLTGAPTSVQVSGGGSVSLAFAALGSSDVMELTGDASIKVAGFVSLSGTFGFKSETTGTKTKILVGASNVNAFIGTPDRSFGVQITNAGFGLAIYRDAGATASTYALKAAAPIQVIGLPADIALSGTGTVSINTTGVAVNETIPGTTQTVVFSNGTNVRSFGGNLTFAVGSPVVFTLTGDFVFTSTQVGTVTKLAIGAANVSSAVGTNVTTDGGKPFTLSNGKLGLVFFSNNGVSQGYSMVVAATGTAVVTEGVGATATLTIRRNTMTTAQNETITVGSSTVPVVFSASEVAVGTPLEAFQQIIVSDAELTIGTFSITAAKGTQTDLRNSSQVVVATTTSLTTVVVKVQNGKDAPALFSISAGSAAYTSFSGTVTPDEAANGSLSKREDGKSWTANDQALVLKNASFSIGSFVSFTVASVDLQYYSVAGENGTTATVTGFGFTGAEINFYANGRTMVTLGCAASFRYSTVDGFKMVSFKDPKVAFLGQTLLGGANPATGPPSGGNEILADAPPRAAAPPAGAITLGPIYLYNPSVSLSNFQFSFGSGTTVNLSADINLSVGAAGIGEEGSLLHASIENLKGSFNVGASFDLLHLDQLPTITSNGFSIRADRFSIGIGSFLTITATGTAQNPLAIDPTAGPAEDLISFGSLTATLSIGAVSISGSATSFAIQGNGSFLAKPGFGVSLSLGPNGASDLSWPSWLPLKSASVGLYWDDFNRDPLDFLIQLSAAVDFTLGTVSLSGSVTNAVIDPQLLFAGQFPIISIDSFAVGASGNLFAGELEGSLVAGIVRFDANGKIVDGLGNLSGTTTKGTAPFTGVFYGGIQGSLVVGGTFGFDIRLGIDAQGPLEGYVELKAQVPLGPPPPVGPFIFLTGLRGGIAFGAPFPELNITDRASDALQLRLPGFLPPSALTASQWEAKLRDQVILRYKNNPSPGSFDFLAAFRSPVRIQAGVSISAANANAFRLDGDVIFDTAGRFLVMGAATFGNTVSVGVKLYTDFSRLFTLTADERLKVDLRFLCLIEVPAQPNALSLPPVYSIYGFVSFSGTANDVALTIGGGAEFNLLGAVKANAEGTLTIRFIFREESTGMPMLTVSLSNGAFTVPTLSPNPLGTAAGTVVLGKADEGARIWGGFLLNLNAQPLEQYGISIDGQVFVKLNTAQDAKQVTLELGGGTTTLQLKPLSFSLFVNGAANFKIANIQVFQLSGALTLDISSGSLAIFVQATLKLGLDPTKPILTFDANGLIYVQLVATATVNTGFAAKMTLTTGASVPSGISFNANWVLVVNTTGSEITFSIPVPVDGGPTIPVVMGPDYASTNPLASVSYEVMVNGQRSLVIPGGPPAEGLTNYTTWAAPPAPYFIVVGRGHLTVANSFFITGALNIRWTGGVFTLDTNATLALKANGNTVFNFNVTGAMRITKEGVVAALTVTLQDNLPVSIGFSFKEATFQVQLNTTGVSATIGSTVVPAGTNGLYANVHITGKLQLLGGVVSLDGTFDLTVTGESLQLGIDANITFFNATLHATGFAGIYYDAHPGMALRIQLSLPGGAQGLAPVAALSSKFVITGTFTLEINTSSISRNDQHGVPIASGFKVAVTNLGVHLFGFDLTGSITISITSAGFGIEIDHLTLDLFGLASISLTGYYRPSGEFKFTGTAGFQFGNHVFGIGGSISVTISNTGFSASVSGWVAAFGVEIGGGGAIAITGTSVDIDVWIHVVLIPSVHIYWPPLKIFGRTIIPGVNYWTPEVAISGTAHFHLGETKSAPAVAPIQPPVPAPTLATVTSGGQLVLNLGADVSSRGTNYGARPAENYVLAFGSAQATTQTIQVTALGFTQTYSGVSSILVRDTLAGNDTISIGSGITVPVNITLGSGNNTINTGGGAATISVTGAGTNTITTANNANITIAGGGANHVTAGSGATLNITGGGANQFTANGGSAPITISGNGNNTVTVNGYSGTVAISGTGSNSINISGGSPTINVLGAASGANQVAVNSSGASTFKIEGAGANQVTMSGTGTATILVTGSGANRVTTGGGATTVTLRGAGANQVSTGAGAVTIYDQGTGGTTVTGGPGGGTFIGGVDSTGKAFTTKAASSLSTAYNNFSIQFSGYSSYTLTNATLSYGSFSLSLTGVRNATLNGAAATATTFTLSGWTGTATLNGAEGVNNTLNSAPGTGTSSINYVLSNSQLQVSGAVTQTITLSRIQTANLTGATTGTNAFDVSAWTGTGTLTGPAGASNTVIATNDVATFTLSNTSLGRAGFGTVTLSGIQVATLTGGAGINTFNASTWSGSATLDGAAGNDVYNLTLAGTGTGVISVTDSGTTSPDVLAITAPSTVVVTSTQVRVGTERVNYTGIETLNVNGTTNGLAYYVQSTAAGATTTIQTGGDTSTVAVGSTAGSTPVAAGHLNGIAGTLSVRGGGTLAIDDTGAAVTRAGTLTPTALTGFGMGTGGIQYQDVSTLTVRLGSGTNTIAVNDINPATHTVIDGGSWTNGTINFTAAANFTGRLDLTSFEHGTIGVAGNFEGTLNSSGPGHFETVAIGNATAKTGSLTTSGRLTVGSIGSMSVVQDLAGVLTVTGDVTAQTIGGNLSGTMSVGGALGSQTVTGTLSGTLTVTGSITSQSVGGLAGTVSVGGNLGTLNVTGALSGVVTVSGNLTTATIGSVSGSLLVTGTLTTLQVGGDVSGTITESGTISLLTIGGSLASGGKITASNAADPARFATGGPATLGNIVTMTVGGNLAGALAVSGTLTSLTIGTTAVNANLTGTVTVNGTLTTLTVNGNVSGTVTESGPVNSIQITGSLLAGGLLKVLNSADPTAMLASVNTLAVGLDVAGTILVSGRLAKLTVGRDVSGSVTEAGVVDELKITGTLTSTGTITISNPTPANASLGTMTVNGDIAGRLTVTGSVTKLTVVGSVTSLTVNGSPAVNIWVGGNLGELSVTGHITGRIHVGGSVTSGTVGGSVSGNIIVVGALSTLRVTGDVSGTVSESGTIELLAIGGSLTASGTIRAENTAAPANAKITTMDVDRNLAGTLNVTGNVGSLLVGTTTATDQLSGTVTVGGTLDTLTVTGSISASGNVWVRGALRVLRVTGHMSGTIVEHGTMDLVDIGGSLTGTITAANATTGELMSMVGMQTLAPPAGNIVRLEIDQNLSGTVTVAGTLTTLIVGGDVSGIVTESGTIETLTIGGSLTATGQINAWNDVTASLGNINTLTIGNNFAGTIRVSGSVGTFKIEHGSMTSTAVLNIGTLETLAIGPDHLSVGQNLAGTLNVGNLQSLRVAGGTPGTIIVTGRIGTIAVYGGFGPVVLNVVENGITRRVELAAPNAPYPSPNPNATVSGTYVNVQFFYESGMLANPQLTARITNGVSNQPSQYDLSLVTYSHTAKFNLARLDAAGVSGVRNVVVEGDLLTAVTAPAAAFFGSNAAAMPGGVRLPSDAVAGVAIRDFAPSGCIQAKTIQAVAFGSHVASDGRLLTGAMTPVEEAVLLLTASTRVVQAKDTLRVAFSDQETQRVGLFIATKPHGGSFNPANVAFIVQGVATANDAGTANTVERSNVARGANTALVTVVAPNTGQGSERDSIIESIAIRGDGASIETRLWISKSITSTGPLGDLTLHSSQGITDVTAPSIFGSIISGGEITGIIQTTGERTDPITGAVSTIPANIGRLYVKMAPHPTVVASVIHAQGGGISGQIISRGNLVSQVIAKGGISGTIGVQGDLGAVRSSGSSTARFGGMVVDGGLTGSVVILEQQLGDVTINGGIRGGVYAVKGGVLGNLVINGMEPGSKVLSGGQLGGSEGTALSILGNNNGIIAAMGAVTFARNKSPGGKVFSSVSPVNAAALEAVFTEGRITLRLDVTGFDLEGLRLIIADLRKLAIGPLGTLGGTTP